MQFVIIVLDFLRIDEKNYEFRFGPKIALFPDLPKFDRHCENSNKKN